MLGDKKLYFHYHSYIGNQTAPNTETMTSVEQWLELEKSKGSTVFLK